MSMRTLINILFAAIVAMAIALCTGCGEKEEVFRLSDFPINSHPVDLDTIPHRYIGEMSDVYGVISEDPNISFGGSHICVKIVDTTVAGNYKSIYPLSRVISPSYMGKTVRISGTLYSAMGHPGMLNMIAYVYVLVD